MKQATPRHAPALTRSLTALGVAAGALLPSGCGTEGGAGGDVLGAIAGAFQGGELNTDTIVAGLKEALQVGTRKAVSRLSQSGGYGDEPALRIETPEALDPLTSTLRRIGLGAQVDLFEAKMNEAAEHAAANATPVFLQAIAGMGIDDAKRILKGSETAATDYFQEHTSAGLKEVYLPIVKGHMEQVGAVARYQELVARYNTIPLVPKIEYNLEDYVTERALEGLFTTLAGAEREIRRDPAARTTELLQRVFGSS